MQEPDTKLEQLDRMMALSKAGRPGKSLVDWKPRTEKKTY